MIHGHFSEAKQGFALLEDVDKATFVRFVRWLYSTDYPALEPKLPSDESAVPSAAEAPQTTWNDDEWGFYTTKKKSKKEKHKEAKKGSLKESFISRKYDIGDVWGTLGAETAWSPPLRSNKASNEDYTEVFLCHARLYVFAEKYDIQPLKELALSKLQQTLAIFTLYPERVGDIISLLKYIYDNTAESEPGCEDIRTMAVHYLGCEMEILVKEGSIKDLLATNSEMLSDFLNMFALRIT